MIRQVKIRNDGKTCNVTSNADIHGVTVRFDNSFTLRLNQDGLEDLTVLLMNVSQDLDTERENLDMSGDPFDQNGDLVSIQEIRDTLKTWADEKEHYQHLLDLAQCSDV
jgi:hypothetical protein